MYPYAVVMYATFVEQVWTALAPMAYTAVGPLTTTPATQQLMRSLREPWCQRRMLHTWHQQGFAEQTENDGRCYCHAFTVYPHLGYHLPAYICTFPSAAGSQRSGCHDLSSAASEASEVCRVNCHTPLHSHAIETV